MPITKVSDKYQVVIPKKTRERLKIKKGQHLYVYAFPESIILTPQKKWPEDYLGSEKDIWSKIDVAKYLDEEHHSWN